ncbi:hypothetical protein [Ornithinibacillus contaminans]|uniref:hypothetical protein n=1 Tax=Ornithinibacillus contaminans TaxID=694055 RepID=UPI00064DD279|nr:hypothetical protein [Ornithinibacillus contaminans]
MKLGIGSLKKKVIVGVVAVGVFTSSTVAFANTDAGAKLREWYQGMFNQSVEDIGEEVTAYGQSKLPGLAAEYNAIKDEAQVDIDLSRELESGQSIEEIINAKLSHIESLDAEQQAILSEIGLEYYDVFLDGYFQIQNLSAQGLNYATNDLTSFTGAAGQAAVEQLTTDINTARDEAVAELEEAIQQAQEALAAEINNQEEITVRNLKNQVDWTIEDLRGQVTALLDSLVEEQQAIITAKAQELEDAAKAALDSVVEGINE